MPNLPTATDRLPPATWIARIAEGLRTTPGLNAEIRRQWGLLEGRKPHDGAWHHEVQAKVVLPYNLVHGTPKTAMVGTKTYPAVSRSQVRGLPDWRFGKVADTHYADLYGRFRKNTRHIYRGVWAGTYGRRGAQTFSGGGQTVEVDHNNFETAERIWFTPTQPHVMVTITDHVDSKTAPGKKAAGILLQNVEAWLKAGKRTVDAGFWDSDLWPQTLYVVTPD